MEIKGKITDIIYQSEETGYAVLQVDVNGDPLVVVGTLPRAKEGYEYSFTGDYKSHNKYGEQFQFREYEEFLPKGRDGVLYFLASGVIKGIGEKTALAIVDTLGERALEILDNNFDEIKKVPGIGTRKAETIRESYLENRQFSKIAMSVKSWGISSSELFKLYKVFGDKVVDLIEENPYLIADRIKGFGFLKADNIAESIGIQKNDPLRIESAVKYILGENSQRGNTYLPREILVEYSRELLDIKEEDIEDCLINMAFEGLIMIALVDSVQCVYLPHMYTSEKYVAHKLYRLHNSTLKEIHNPIDSTVEMLQGESNINFSEEQISAVKNSLNNGVSVITGGPGTGKTTIINMLIKIFQREGFKIALAAPTGRAAKRMTETTSHKASTIHRMIEYAYSESDDVMVFGKDQDDPLKYDVIIVDEMSMVDILLMKSLLDAIEDGTRVIFSGDMDQLPSVGAGNVLRDIIDSSYIETAKLNQIFRQGKESMIVVNAHRINGGKMPLPNESEKDFFVMERFMDAEIIDLTLDLVSNRLPSYYNIKNPKSDIQVLTPLKKGDVGTINLNIQMQEKLNPPSEGKKEKKAFGRIFREGDKVMQVKNNYQLAWKKVEDFSDGQGVFNGDVGYVMSIDLDENSLLVLFDNERLVTYEFMDLDQLELAYAMTIHKSQGSEFPIVVIPIQRIPPVIATRNLLYTGITRGKTLVIIIGTNNKLEFMVHNNKVEKRYSGLKYRIINQFQSI